MEIAAVHLTTTDLAAQRAFYTEVLGLAARPSAPDALTLQLGASQLTFTADGAEMAGIYHVAFDVPEHQFVEARDWLAARVPLVGDATGRVVFHFADWRAHAVYFLDPAGNILELIARHTRPSHASAPFAATSLLSLSEIGLVVDDVPAMVAYLDEALGLESYYGSSPTFTAVGDDRGLLIVVQRGRAWYPDQRMPAVPLPLTVALTDRAGRPRVLSGPPYRAVAD